MQIHTHHKRNASHQCMSACLLRDPLKENVDPQTSQEYGLLQVCVCTHIFKTEFTGNVDLAHKYGFPLEWNHVFF